MNTYEVVAYRDGNWWTFEIPSLTAPSPRGEGHRIVAMGQARRAQDIADEARGVAALWNDVDVDAVSVEVAYRVPDDVREAMAKAREFDADGRAALDEAARLRRRAVQKLRATGLSQADSAAVLGLSRQRIQQLESA